MSTPRPFSAEERRQWQAFFQKEIERLLRHPLLIESERWQSLAREKGARSYKIIEPWQAVAERLQVQLLVAAQAIHPERARSIGFHVSLGPLDDPESTLVYAAQLYTRLSRAQVYLWSNLIHSHVRLSPPLPRHTISSTILPYPQMFWSRETAVGRDNAIYETNWALISQEQGGFSVTVDNITNPDIPETPNFFRVGGGIIRYGSTWPDDFRTLPDEQFTGWEYVLKALAFLVSPFVETISRRVPRTFRKEAARANIPTTEADPLIHTVLLRQPEQHPLPGSQEEHDFTRKHHWWVSGHYRAQWYAAKQEHKVIWIAPHIRGDRSLPLLEKVYAVQR